MESRQAESSRDTSENISDSVELKLMSLKYSSMESLGESVRGGGQCLPAAPLTTPEPPDEAEEEDDGEAEEDVGEAEEDDDKEAEEDDDDEAEEDVGKAEEEAEGGLTGAAALSCRSPSSTGLYRTRLAWNLK